MIEQEIYNVLASNQMDVPSQEIKSHGITRYGKNKCNYIIPVGNGYLFGDWSRGFQDTWFPKSNKKFSPEELAKRNKAIKEAMQQERLRRESLQKETAKKALNLYHNAKSKGFSEYLRKKQIEGINSVKFEGNNVFILMKDTNNKTWNLQIIYSNGDKRFLKNGKKQGCYHIIGEDKFRNSTKVFFVEGFATGASIYMATGIPTVVCFDAGNIGLVVAEVKSKYPEKEYVIAADDDAYNKANIGVEKASEVACKYGLKHMFPSSKTDHLNLQISMICTAWQV